MPKGKRYNKRDDNPKRTVIYLAEKIRTRAKEIAGRNKLSAMVQELLAEMIGKHDGRLK